jgi:excisionase family DNA binding protein
MDSGYLRGTTPGRAGQSREPPFTFSAQFAVGKRGRPRTDPFSRVVPRPSKSGRQDLNLRPLGPEGPQGDPHGVVPGGTASHPFDITGNASDAGFHPVAPFPPDETPFGALVVQATLGALLTVGEVATRLRVSRATVYRLVRLGSIPALRVSNSIRISADALAWSPP